MMAYGYSPEAPTAGGPPHTTATAAEALILVTRLWPVILAVAAVGDSLALAFVAAVVVYETVLIAVFSHPRQGRSGMAAP